MNRARLLLLAVLAFAVPVAGVAYGPDAGAAVRQPAAVKVVLSAPVADVRVTATSDRSTTAHGGHGGALYLPVRQPGWPVAIEAWSNGPVLLFAGKVQSASLIPGEQRWEIEDYGDGRVTGVPVTVLRATGMGRLELIRFGGPARAIIAGNVAVTHYDPARYAWTPSPYSPVMVQVLTRGAWRTVSTWTTDANGIAAGVAMIGNGAQRLRMVRPEGARDAMATSPERVI